MSKGTTRRRAVRESPQHTQREGETREKGNSLSDLFRGGRREEKGEKMRTYRNCSRSKYFSAASNTFARFCGPLPGDIDS